MFRFRWTVDGNHRCLGFRQVDSGRATFFTERWPEISTVAWLSQARMRQLKGSSTSTRVIEIDQSPIGRTPRSNPATYTGLFTPIRELYAMLPESASAAIKPGRFSFNVKGGRCEACQGDGLKRIEMNFLPDVYVTCEVCRGARYNRETLDVRYQGRSIAEMLDTTVEEALPMLENIPAINAKLQTLSRSRTRLHQAWSVGDDALRR